LFLILGFQLLDRFDEDGGQFGVRYRFVAVFIFRHQLRQHLLYILGNETDLLAFCEPEVRILLRFPFVADPLEAGHLFQASLQGLDVFLQTYIRGAGSCDRAKSPVDLHLIGVKLPIDKGAGSVRIVDVKPVGSCFMTTGLIADKDVSASGLIFLAGEIPKEGVFLAGGVAHSGVHAQKDVILSIGVARSGSPADKGVSVSLVVG